MVLERLAKESLLLPVEMPSSRIIQPEKAAHRLICRPSQASKADAMCKDLVNAPRKQEAVQEGIATVSFLGAGGKEITVDCPKVCGDHLFAFLTDLLFCWPLNSTMQLVESQMLQSNGFLALHPWFLTCFS